MLWRAYGVEAVALRYHNVYGPRQALGNPYTGVAAIFAARVLSGRRPVVFEDGRQLRDLVHVDDAVRATWTRSRSWRPSSNTTGRRPDRTRAAKIAATPV